MASPPTPNFAAKAFFQISDTSWALQSYWALGPVSAVPSGQGGPVAPFMREEEGQQRDREHS